MTMSSTYLSTVEATALAERIVQWLRDQLAATGAKRFVLGLSGGLDSAVVAGLCAKAAGPENVLGVMMPSSSNPQDAVEARKVADAFGITTTVVNLTGVADTMFGQLPDAQALYRDVLGGDPGEGVEAREELARANIRPRLRMMTLYYLANLSHGVVIGTGNKSEVMIGYFTKYGDSGVDLFALSDLYKYEVREVARVLGVPDSVISRPPSAGLWEGQTDEDEIGITYEVLDTVLQAIDRGETEGIDPDVLAKVQGMIDRNKHKRTAVPAFRR